MEIGDLARPAGSGQIRERFAARQSATAVSSKNSSAAMPASATPRAPAKENRIEKFNHTL
jgi:hypothetical protein